MFIHPVPDWSYRLSNVLKATFSAIYNVNHITESGDVTGDCTHFFLSPFPFLETGSLSLLATLSSKAVVSLLTLVVGIGVPLVGVLKALVL